MSRQKITTFLWYDNNAVEAANFYVSLFEDSRVNEIVPGPNGTALVVKFTLGGVDYIALNGGPYYKLNEAVSLSVDCADQAEIDELWEKLTADGGSTSQCGWLKDRFGLSWQIVPAALGKLMTDPDPARSGRVMGALMQMVKIDIAALEAAHAGTP